MWYKKMIYSTLFIFSYIPLAFSQGSGNAIDFQANRYIGPPVGTNLSPSDEFTDITFECWAFWKGLQNGNSGILEGRSTGIHFEITDDNTLGRIRARVNGNQLEVYNAVPKNEWVHLAFVYDNTLDNLTIYVNGVNIGTNSGNSGANNFTDFLRIGVSCCGDVNPTNESRPFNGLLDEVRIWYKAKTENQIRENMCSILTGNETDLVIYYKMDEIFNDTIYDSSQNANHGILYNINSTHMLTSGAPLGNESVYLYPPDWTSATLNLASTDRGIFSIENVTGNPDGVHIYKVNAVPNEVPVLGGLGNNETYFGTFLTGGSSVIYEAVFNYGNYPDALTDVYNLVLNRRNDNSDSLWINSLAVLNILNNTLTDNGLISRHEFILSNSATPLPITLLEFNAKVFENKEVHLDWTTVSEVSNDYFSVERTNNGKIFDEIGRLKGGGNTNIMQKYFFTDTYPLDKTSYYRLKQVDFDGSFSYSDLVSVEVSKEKNFSLLLYPNPKGASTSINVSISGEKDCEVLIVVMDFTGKEYYSKIIALDESEKVIAIDPSRKLSPGFYLIIASSNNNLYNKKLIVK